MYWFHSLLQELRNNMADNDDKKKRNPWGGSKNAGNTPIRGPWGSQGNSNSGRGSSGGSDIPPDLDDFIKKARENFNGGIPPQFGNGKLIIIALLVVFLGWMATGIYFVQPAEHAVIQRFGKWSHTQTEAGPGWHLPYPFETATILNVQELRRMTIGFSEPVSVDRFGRLSNSSQRSNSRDIPEESLMLTSGRNIVDIHLVVLWNIRSAEDFLFNIEDQENTIKKVAESAIREVVGQNQMFPIITNKRQDIADRAQEILQKNLDDYHSGVNISNVLIEKAEVHPDVQSAFQDVQSAKQDAEDIQNQADAYREDILPKARGQAIEMRQQAEGYKQSVIARSTGDAERFKQVLTAYRMGEDVTKRRIYIETMENILQNANKIILDQSEGGQNIVPYLPLNELNKQRQSDR
jgi:modulator of FtsH protease HflK